jgi:hypothetical protein
MPRASPAGLKIQHLRFLLSPCCFGGSCRRSTAVVETSVATMAMLLLLLLLLLIPTGVSNVRFGRFAT